MKTMRFILKAFQVLCLFLTSTLIFSGCAPKKPALRPAISQTAITVQRNDPETNEGGLIDIFIDNVKDENEGLKDGQTKSYIVNNGVHTIHVKCPKGESAALNFTANSQTVAFLTAYKSPGFLAIFSKAECRLERMTVDDDTGYTTDRKTQQSYNKQQKENSSQNYDATEELEKLAKLKDKGVITEEEFNAKKKQLLGL
jgi:hypothetical protein